MCQRNWRRMLGPEFQRLINALGRDEIDLVAFTSASQASNLFTVAQYNGKEASLKQSLGRTLVASIGPGVQRRAPQARREGRYRSTTAEAGAVY
jgi:uroporphyrinogen-III synthase